MIHFTFALSCFIIFSGCRSPIQSLQLVHILHAHVHKKTQNTKIYDLSSYFGVVDSIVDQPRRVSCSNLYLIWATHSSHHLFRLSLLPAFLFLHIFFL